MTTQDEALRLADALDQTTPNWMRESFGHWKDCTIKYDRAPFEAAAMLRQQTAEIGVLHKELGECVGALECTGHPIEWQQKIDAQAAEIERLREALDQLLDDMGTDGHCVCEDAKQQAIAALQPNVRGKLGGTYP